jgi:hypothetical protein
LLSITVESGGLSWTVEWNYDFANRLDIDCKKFNFLSSISCAARS